MKKFGNRKVVLLFFIVILIAVVAFMAQRYISNKTIQSTTANTNNLETKNNWREYVFKDVGLTFSAPSDLNVSSDQSIKDSFTFIVQRGKYPEKEYYQLYAVYNLAARNVLTADLKKDLEPSSIKEKTIGGFPSISGQYKGDRNRFVSFIITNRGLLTLATSQPTEENKSLTDTILNTFKFE